MGTGLPVPPWEDTDAEAWLEIPFCVNVPALCSSELGLRMNWRRIWMAKRKTQASQKCGRGIAYLLLHQIIYVCRANLL